jgi:nitrogen regulatory protein P-II 1
MLELIIAVIKPHKLEDVKTALLANGVEGMTITEVSGFGRQRGKTENFRGSEYKIDFVPKVKVEVIVPVEQADAIVTAIAEAAQTGKIGDGKIWRIGVDSLLRVRTGELDIDAL